MEVLVIIIIGIMVFGIVRGFKNYSYPKCPMCGKDMTFGERSGGYYQNGQRKVGYKCKQCNHFFLS